MMSTLDRLTMRALDIVTYPLVVRAVRAHDETQRRNVAGANVVSLRLARASARPRRAAHGQAPLNARR
jgi:hypothetical protein